MKLSRLVLILLALLSIGFTASAQKPSAPSAPSAPTAKQSTAHVASKNKKKPKTTGHSVTLNWVQGVVPTGTTCTGGGSAAVTSNAVFRGTTSGGEGTTPYATLSTPATTYTDTAVTGGTTYFYTVTATNCNGPSTASNEASALVPNPLVPNAPTGLTASAQ